MARLVVKPGEVVVRDESGKAQGVTREATLARQVRADRTKKEMLRLLEQGYSIAETERLVDAKPGRFKYYCRSDEQFRLDAERARARRRIGLQPRDPGGFEEFSEKYLKQRMFRHQLQWLDLLEGREPRDLHPAQRFHAGDPNSVIINTPPEHAKSTTITQNYVTYRICKDPTVRILVVSKTQSMAKKFLTGIKARLTSRRYDDLIRDFAPQDGFDGGSAIWRNDMIYVNQADTEDGVAEKDPTVEALGIGGQIYGARADLIILDDCVTLDNVGQVENQIDWVQQEVMSRLGGFGRMIVVGTRVAPVDLYTELANPQRYPTGESPWTYLSQPAVLEMTDDPADWVTLWPRSNMPMKGDTKSQPDADGLFPYWTGPQMVKVRNRMQPRTWAMVYMQQQVDDEAVFPAEDVQGCVDGYRASGNLHPDGGVDKGSEWYVIAGMDPATVNGYTAITVLGFNRRTHKRRVIQVYNDRLTPDAMVNRMKDVTVRFGVDEWRVEKNAFQAFLTQTKEVVQFMASRGVLLREHHTGAYNKFSPDFGVAAMAMLFRGWRDGANLIELPRKDNEGVRALMEQLIIWTPEPPKTQKTDAVMSLWFAELRARELVSAQGSATWASGGDQWLSGAAKQERVVLNIEEYMAQAREDRVRTEYLWSHSG